MKTTSRLKKETPPKPQMIRCAIYTRKSTDEGLDQEFNSLDAQREAAEAFIQSQRHEGWVVLPERYDDGGFSGGNMERPALKKLIEDVKAGGIEAIVVYKVDRLSRSLMDFSRIMETLDQQSCSFVSVTQQFNTTHSMGRLTLNILLSFAQFEREIISERTRDKMSAARKKGKWVGGVPILGYRKDPEKMRLLIDEVEAPMVKAIFELFLEKGSILPTVQALNQRGWQRKTWLSQKGKMLGGGPWTKSNLHLLLTNYTYIGKVSFKGNIYPGEHEAIIDESTWEQVQSILGRNSRSRNAFRNKSGSLLRGLLKCGSCGHTMTHTYSQKDNKRYRYYVCQQALKQGYASCKTKSIPVQEIESFVIERISMIKNEPNLIKDVEQQAQKQKAQKLASLTEEEKLLRATIKRHAREVGRNVTNQLAPELLSNIEDQIRLAENRLHEIFGEKEKLLSLHFDKQHVAKALENFESTFESLAPSDQEKLIKLLIKQIVYNKEKGTISITFNSSSFKTLTEETP